MVAFLLTLVALGLVAPPEPKTERVDPTTRMLLNAHNAERKKAKLPPLELNPELSAAAERHARDMVKHEAMRHEGSDGSTPHKRILEAKFQGRSTGENVAMGQRTVPQVMKEWMESPGHKANVLGDFNRMGCAVRRTNAGRPYWCVTFGDVWTDVDPDAEEAALVAAINAARKDKGLGPLVLDKQLAGRCRAQAVALAAGAEGPDMKALSRGLKYATLQGLASKGHRDAKELLASFPMGTGTEGDFTHVGAGVANSSDGGPRWFVAFGTER